MPTDFFTEDLDADEREIVMQTEITQSIQHPNDIRDGTVCDRSLARWHSELCRIQLCRLDLE